MMRGTGSKAPPARLEEGTSWTGSCGATGGGPRTYAAAMRMSAKRARRAAALTGTAMYGRTGAAVGGGGGGGGAVACGA